MAKSFHDHLDKCRQCRENPFDLCVTGQTIMQMELNFGPLPAQLALNSDGLAPGDTRGENSETATGSSNPQSQEPAG
jgi:hypothetical protein